MENDTVNLDEGMENELKEIKVLTEENNKMLHSIQRRARFGMVWKTIYWIAVIGATLGAFYFIQPYINQLTEAYEGIKSTQQKAADFKANFSLDSLKEYFGSDSTAQ